MTTATTKTTQDADAAPKESALAQHTTSAMTLALRDESYRLALEPKTFGETMTACEFLSQAGIKGCESAPLVLAKVMAGRALGIGFMASIMGIDNIEGTMALRSRLKLALCLRARHVCEYFRCIESTHEKATWECKRVGDDKPRRWTFTIEDAQKAGLLDRGATPEAKAKSNWNRWTSAMLRARAASQLADMVFPDVTGGMAAREDLEGGVAPDDDELVGEVVPNAQKRDWAAEAKALVDKIDTITPETPPAARKPIRDEAMAFVAEAPEPHKGLVGKAFNDTPKYVAPKPAQAPAATNSAPTGG